MAAVLLGNLQNQARAKGQADSFSSTTVTIISPISGPLRSAVAGLSDLTVGILAGPQLAIENKALRDQAQTASLYVENVERLSREVDSLRQLLDFPPVPGRTKVAAVIQGYFAHEHRITLTVGQAQGIRPGMPVVTAKGLLAIIQTVEPNRSQALLLSSASVQLGGLVSNRNPAQAGLMRGNGSVMTLTFEDPKAPVEIGDRVTTSGFSDRIPRGIPIGRIVQVNDNPAFGVRTADVLPDVSVGEVREVLVLK
ncbi:MAG: rod shape-determining protein MreC [Fimbriimonas sp.]